VGTRVFTAFGLPRRLRTDNGGPVATNPLARRSQLPAWWGRLGSWPACIEPGKPAQTGRPKRLHRPRQAESTRPPGAPLRAQQQPFTHGREAFNHARPPEALDRRTPAVWYDPSPRPLPNNLPPREHPDRFEGRSVSAHGGRRWPSQGVNVSPTGAGDDVGLEAIDAGIWHVDCGPLTCGRRLARHLRLEDAYGRLTRHR
jgi:putative transposase